MRVNHSDDDSYITDLITVARQSAEISTRRVLGDEATIVASYDCFPLYQKSYRIPNPPIISFKAGYTSAIIPKPLKQAILLLISHYYDIREPILTTGTIQKVPRSVDFIFNQYKIRSV